VTGISGPDRGPPGQDCASLGRYRVLADETAGGVVTAVWDSRSIDLGDRQDALQQTIRDHVVDVHLALPSRPEDVSAQVALSMTGRLQVCSVRAMPTVVTRTPRQASQDSAPSLFATLQMQGTSMMVQHGREAVLQTGDLAVYATTEPYTLIFDQGVRNHFFRVPTADLGLSARTIRAVSARRLSHHDPVVRLTSDFMRGLADTQMSEAVGTLGPAAVELLRATLLDSEDADRVREDTTAQTLVASVRSHIRQHLHDPELCVASIAAAHHVSVRHLCSVLATAGMAPGETIRAERLERARTDLARPELAAWTVAAIGRRWCFPNAAHFGQVFRQRFGVSPAQWRSQARTASSATP